jgi:hypothetical protein
MATPAKMFHPGESRRRPIDLKLDAPPEAQLGELYRRLITEDPEQRMPKDSPPLDEDQIEAVRAWLAHGAPVDGGLETPLEHFVPAPLSLEPRWETYPAPMAVQALAIDDATGQVFASGAQEVLVWDGQGHWLGRIPTRGRMIADLEWNPTLRALCISSGDPGRIGYVESVPWSAEENRATESARIVHWIARDIPLDLSVAPTGDRLAIGTQDGMVLVVKTSSKEIVWKSAAHAAAVTGVDWSADATFVASSSRDRMAKSFDADTGDILTSFVDHERTVASIRSLHVGCVTMDEAGVLRLYPGAKSSQPRASWGGFLQQTPKLVSSRETVWVPVPGGLRSFLVRVEEVVESKGEDGKEKKKTQFRFEEQKRLEFQERETMVPLSTATTTGEPAVVAAGLSDGEIWLWPADREQSAIHWRNRPPAIEEPR